MGPITLLILNMIFNIIYYVMCGIIVFKSIKKTLFGENTNMIFLLPILYYVAFLILSYTKDFAIGYASAAVTIQRINCSGKMNTEFVTTNALKYANKNILPLTIILLPKFLTDSGLLMAHKTKGLYAFSKVLNGEFGPLNLMELLVWGPFKSLFVEGSEPMAKGSIPKYFQRIQQNMFSDKNEQSGGRRKFTLKKIFKKAGIGYLVGGEEGFVAREPGVETELFGDEPDQGLINSETVDPTSISNILFEDNYVYAAQVTFGLAFYMTFINAINYFELLLYTERYGCAMSPTEKIKLHNKIRKSMSECNPNNVKSTKEVSV